jgi:hypothetical protein
MEYYSAFKRNEILQKEIHMSELWNIRLSEIK